MPTEINMNWYKLLNLRKLETINTFSKKDVKTPNFAK
jgi:hypothetical protein